MSSRVANRVEDAVEHLGGDVINVTDDGEVDFKLDGIDGFARERHGKFRASLFIVYDPKPDEAERFVREHHGLPYGEAQFAEHEDGSFIRLLLELPFDNGQGIWASAHTARALHAAWLSRNGGGEDLRARLGDAGIAVPPLGEFGLPDIHTYGAWSWGSRYVPPITLYMFEVELIARQLVEHGPLFALSHAGHGANSYGLNLVTTSGPIGAYVQHGYGGAYMDPVSGLIDLNATYSRLNVLFRATQSRIDEDLRWLIVMSDFRGGNGILDLDAVRLKRSFDEAFETHDDEKDLFSAAAGRFPEYDFAPGLGGVSW